MDCIIIGGGIIGASIADQLAIRGVKVILLEKAFPGAGTSSKSFGWINATAADTKAYFRLRLEAIKSFKTLSKELDLTKEVSWTGSLWYESSGQTLVNHYELMRSMGYDYELLNSDSFSELEPNILNVPDKSIRAEIEGSANGYLLVKSLLKRAQENGATVLTGCEVQSVKFESTKRLEIISDKGCFFADKLILAVGKWTENFLKSLGICLPMRNKDGIIVRTTPLPKLLNHIIVSPEILFKQDAHGRIMVGETVPKLESDGGCDVAIFAKTMMDKLKRILKGVGSANISAIELGTRPIPLDGYPVIGNAEGVDNIYIAVMHSGITLGPLVGGLVAEEVLGADNSKFLKNFRHERFKNF